MGEQADKNVKVTATLLEEIERLLAPGDSRGDLIALAVGEARAMLEARKARVVSALRTDAGTPVGVGA